MNNDEGNMHGQDKGPLQLQQLEQVLEQVMVGLEKGRNDVFDIANDCHKQISLLNKELEAINQANLEIIEQVEACEKQERLARIRLMEVSRRFNKFAEQEVKEVYDNARGLQLKLQEIRQKERYLRSRRDELARQIKQYQLISRKAERFLNSAATSLKLLQGNVGKIGDTLDEVYRKQQMEIWIIESQEAERRKIAREIHDGPAQSLASMLIRLDLVARMITNEQKNVQQELSDIKEIGQESLTDIRRIMFDLKPALVNDECFSTALKEYFNDYEAKYNFDIEFVQLGQEDKYDLAVELGLYRMVQEAITNVRKHAGVNKALVKMEDSGKNLTLIIKDEGQGFDINRMANRQESYGILGMKERVKLFGGQLDIKSSPGAGTQIIITVPVEGEANNERQDKGYYSR
ncbi:sensor histidine kinase [Syntrophomonas erecta]